MSYHVYHTEALILGSLPSGEGDRLIFCYTRELGLVMANARSIRESRSRLRYILQTFAHAEIDLIRGKYGWKLISARPLRSFAHIWEHKEKRQILAQSTTLLRRLVQGEERHAELFDDLLSGLGFLHEVETETELRSLELLFAVRMLSGLGYWGTEEEFASLVCDEGWCRSSLELLTASRPAVLSSVNQALKETQL